MNYYEDPVAIYDSNEEYLPEEQHTHNCLFGCVTFLFCAFLFIICITIYALYS